MTNTSPYTDARQALFRTFYEKALPYSDYVSQGQPAHQARWEDFRLGISLSLEQTTLVKGFQRKLHLLVLSGVWCGDCARQGPMLQAIADASSMIEARFIDNKDFPELQDELRILGAERVPVVVGLSEDFFEVFRFGDRHLSVYRRKAAAELGAACDPGLLPPPAEELAVELSEWLGLIERAQLLLRLSPMLRKRYND